MSEPSYSVATIAELQRPDGWSPIRRELGVSDTAMGFLTGGAFAVFYTFAGIPIAVAAVVYALVYATSGRRNSKRHRPGLSLIHI